MGGKRSVNWRGAIARELRSVGLATLYFLGCFGVILTLKKLFLADYHIETYALSTAVFGALIAAKVVVTLDHTRAGTRFDASRALITGVSYKTLVYGVAAFAVLFAEETFQAYRAHGALGAALAELWAHRDRNVILAKAICVGLAFAGYHLYTGIDRRLGEGTLWRILGSHSDPPHAGQGEPSPPDGRVSTAMRKERNDGPRTETQHSRHLG
jgi:hypothetical protein